MRGTVANKECHPETHDADLPVSRTLLFYKSYVQGRQRYPSDTTTGQRYKKHRRSEAAPSASA